jgi:hypothetical protein
MVNVLTGCGVLTASDFVDYNPQKPLTCAAGAFCLEPVFRGLQLTGSPVEFFCTTHLRFNVECATAEEKTFAVVELPAQESPRFLA